MSDKILKWLIDRIVRAAQDKLYGSIIIKFEGGVITCLKTETTEKPLKD